MTFADKASAQQLPQTSISYSAEPSGLVSVTAEGQIIVLSQPAAGLMTATISGVGFTLVSGEYVRTGYTGEQFLTLRFLTSCSINDGCDAFGLNASSRQERVLAFRRMRLTTLSMFIASGANVNEVIDGNAGQADNFLLYQMAVVGNSPAVSLLVTAGANINAADLQGATMLHVAASRINPDTRLLTLFLALEGISVNAKDNGGNTPLDRLSQIHGLFPSSARLEHGEILRNAGGRCITQADNDPPSPICGTPQNNPNIALPNNANKTFIIRSPDINTPGVIGNLSTPPRR